MTQNTCVKCLMFLHKYPFLKVLVLNLINDLVGWKIWMISIIWGVVIPGDFFKKYILPALYYRVDNRSRVY